MSKKLLAIVFTAGTVCFACRLSAEDLTLAADTLDPTRLLLTTSDNPYHDHDFAGTIGGGFVKALLPRPPLFLAESPAP